MDKKHLQASIENLNQSENLYKIVLILIIKLIVLWTREHNILKNYKTKNKERDQEILEKIIKQDHEFSTISAKEVKVQQSV